MSKYDNLYLCPICDNVGQLRLQPIVCDKCGFGRCFVARHINEGTRKFWMKRESDFGRWRFENKFKPMMKNFLVEDKELARAFTKSVKDLFNEFVANRDDLTGIFPKFTRDYRKTTGKRESGWKRRNGSASITKQKNSSLAFAISAYFTLNAH